MRKQLLVLGLIAAVGATITLGFPALSYGQVLAREALSSFPAYTQQMAYLNLAQLRLLPDYPQIRRWLLIRQIRDFEGFIRAPGTDTERDVDERE